MPLFPPPDPVIHPADLVVDQFGTFLGRKSERLVIRWKEPRNPAVLANPLDVPSHQFTPGPTSETADVGTEITGSASSAVAPVRDSEPKASVDPAVRELLKIWAEEGVLRNDANKPVLLSRLQQQLESMAEPPVGDRLPTGWKERAVPLSRLRSLTIAGKGITVSSDLIAALVERGVTLSFLSGRGQPVAQLSAPGLGGTVQTRRSQLEAYESARGVALAVEFVRGKLRNQSHQLQYSGKYLKATDVDRFERLSRKIRALTALRKQVQAITSDHLELVRNRLMGLEGTGARLYWEGVAILLEGRVEFPGRTTRGAIDPVNSALNYGYGILYGQVAGAIVNAGLEMYAGFLHVDRPGKPALVLDLVEEFRAPVVDRTVLAIINLGTLLHVDSHGLTSSTRRLIADRILERLSTSVPYEGKRWPIGTIIQNQARHLAVAVRGERSYRAFASRW